MTREEQLLFCKKCLNRKMDMKQGLICKITEEKATFEDECPEFKRDETVEDSHLDDKENFQLEEIKQKLPPEVIERLRMEQKFIPALVGGSVVGLVGAILWGAIVLETGYEVGYVALAIGAAVGFTIREFGKGLDQTFGYMGGIIAFLSLVLGKFFGIIGFVAHLEGIDFMTTLAQFNYSLMPNILLSTFSVIDLLFYGIAIYEGYRFSFRKITEKRMTELLKANRNVEN